MSKFKIHWNNIRLLLCYCCWHNCFARIYVLYNKFWKLVLHLDHFKTYQKRSPNVPKSGVCPPEFLVLDAFDGRDVRVILAGQGVFGDWDVVAGQLFVPPFLVDQVDETLSLKRDAGHSISLEVLYITTDSNNMHTCIHFKTTNQMSATCTARACYLAFEKRKF